jgi:DNA mismatch repair protein MutS
MKPNDVNITMLCNMQLLFGPNSSGKTTYLRQIGLLCVLAQAGLWVPAKAMCIHPFSHICTRMSMQETVRVNSSSFMLEAQVGVAYCAVHGE